MKVTKKELKALIKEIATKQLVEKKLLKEYNSPFLNQLAPKFDAAMMKWRTGIDEYMEVMTILSSQSDPSMKEIGNRGLNTGRRLGEQASAIQDDLYVLDSELGG